MHQKGKFEGVFCRVGLILNEITVLERILLVALKKCEIFALIA